MNVRIRVLRLTVSGTVCFVCTTLLAAQQQQPTIGSIASRDAMVTGGLQVQGEHAELLTSASITAYNRTAPIELTRGGDVLVCSTSRFHILRSGTDASLIFALDRGAIEIHTDSQRQDVVMTPDLRMTFATSGPLDLRVRVTPNGDTCVENTGKSSPEIAVSDAFSDAVYHLRPSQHVLFEHGNLREVVDQEPSPCGCPIESALPARVTQKNTAVADAAEHNPFPAAVSQGLAPETKPVVASPAPAASNDETKTEVASTMAYTAKQEEPAPASTATATQAPAAASATMTSLAPPPSPPGAHDIVHAIGRFFHRLFHGKPQDSQDSQR